MELFADLLLLADVAETVASCPALLEVETQGTGACLGLEIEGKQRSLGAKRAFKNVDKEAPMIVPRPGICKKRKPETGPKKRKTVPAPVPVSAVATRKDLAVEVRSKIGDLCGTDVKLIMEKKLTSSDLNRNLGWFSIPESLVLANFLEQEETRSLENGGVIAVPVVIKPCLGVSNLTLKRWRMSTRPVYVLTTGWNTIARNMSNGLEQDEPIQLWSFRTGGNIGFAIVKAMVVAGTGSNKYNPSSPSSVLTERT